MNVNELCGQRLKALRNEKKLSQDEVAKGVGITRTTLTHYERGTRTMNIEILNSFARYFEVSCDYLTGASNCSSPSIDIQAICKYTGLSEDAVQELYIWAHFLPKAISTLDEIIRYFPTDSFYCIWELKEKSSVLTDKHMLLYSFEHEVQCALSSYLSQHRIDIHGDNYPKWKTVANEVLQQKKKQIPASQHVAEIMRQENMSEIDLVRSYTKDCSLARYELIKKFEEYLIYFDERTRFETTIGDPEVESELLEYIGFTQEELKDIMSKVKEEIENVQHPQTNE